MCRQTEKVQFQLGTVQTPFITSKTCLIKECYKEVLEGSPMNLVFALIVFRKPGAAFPSQARIMPTLDGLSMIPYSTEPSPQEALSGFEAINPGKVLSQAKI